MEREELLLAITRCPEIAKARDDAAHPCRKVVCFQQDAAGYHVPEPWQGRIETAPILFVSLNPGYGAGEVFPTPAWDDAITVDFFQRRFDPAAYWTSQSSLGGIHPLMRDAYGNEVFSGRHTPQWAMIRGYARELLGHEPDFGQDIAMTMAVHCKSKSGAAPKPALRLCPQKWLPGIVECSPAAILVLLGAETRDACAKMWGFDRTPRVQFGVPLPGGERALVLLPHSNTWGRKDFDYYVSSEDLRKLRALLPPEYQ